MICRVIQYSGKYHAIVMDSQGKVHHKSFMAREQAEAYVALYRGSKHDVVYYDV